MGLARRLLLALSVLVTASPVAFAQGAPLSAIVGVAARVPPSARTAEVLGRHRFGTGIVIDGSGLVVTVGYLLLEATEAKLVVDLERSVPADIVAYDHRSGLGLLRAREPLGVTPLPLGDDAGLDVGAALLVVSYGGEAAVRPGVLIARQPFTGYWEFLLEDALMVAPPHPRFAGAALIGPDGKLVGIGTLLARGAHAEGQSLPATLFTPVSLLREVLPALLANGRSDQPPRPWLGLYLSEQEGLVRVIQLAVEGPALAAGVEIGDVLVGIDGMPVKDLADLYRRVWSKGEAGVTLSLDVLRGGSLQSLLVTSTDRYAWLRQAPAR